MGIYKSILGAIHYFGGNSGYVGYSKSKRAVEAERRGLRSKSQMDKDFAKAVNDSLLSINPNNKTVKVSEIKKYLDNIKPTEWHHTSKYGNRTNYYSVQDVADYFLENNPLTPSQLAEKEKLKLKRQLLDNDYNKIHKSAMSFIVEQLTPYSSKYKGNTLYYLYKLPFYNAFIALSENDIINNRVNYIFFNDDFFDVYLKPHSISENTWLKILGVVDEFPKRIADIKNSQEFNKFAALAEDINRQRREIDFNLNRI